MKQETITLTAKMLSELPWNLAGMECEHPKMSGDTYLIGTSGTLWRKSETDVIVPYLVVFNDSHEGYVELEADEYVIVPISVLVATVLGSMEMVWDYKPVMAWTSSNGNPIVIMATTLTTEFCEVSRPYQVPDWFPMQGTWRKTDNGWKGDEG